MEQVASPGLDLFAGTTPSMADVRQLTHSVNSTDRSRMAFAQQLEGHLADTSAKTLLATGIGLCVLGRYREAADKLKKAHDCAEKYLCLAQALERTGRYADAVAALDKCLQFNADTLAVNMEKAAAYRKAGDFDAAAKQLKACANFAKVSAEYHYQLGRLQEAQGLYTEAVGSYKAALELSADHQKARFHLAYRYDLSGDEQAALDQYRQIATKGPLYVSALLNMAVIYEDLGRFAKAAQCVDAVLESHPTHRRAILFKKDIESSKTMYYDEEKEKRRSRKNQILETPITDFELSVRSRNCLKKMNIRTIGDLLNITETELLSYKNFGETSLKEIKTVLEAKGLYLGMALEDKAFAMEPEVEETPSETDALMHKPVEDLQLSVRARKCLQTLNLNTLGDLVRRTDAELLGCKNFGVTSLNEIKKALAGLGLSLRSLD
ncbi:MAG TPA: tetratricopeptide repeat protein [Phycisphaerales bacterium]|nr:tetratricopeptide repeat protein [Phycisphaerales bacterium]